MRKISLKRIFKILIIAMATMLLLLLLFVAFLPTLVSIPAAQKKIQDSLSTAMKRQVAWSTFSFGWSDGIRLSALKLGDGPPPLLTSDIDRIDIIPSFGRVADGRFGVDLVVRIKNVRADFAPGPPKPPAPPSGKDPLTMLAESIQKVHGLDFPLPLDVRVQVEVSPVHITYHAPSKELKLQNFSFRFAMPSLAAKPILTELHGQLSVDGRDVGKIGLTATVSDLVTPSQRIHPASALVAVEASAPGTALTMSGGLSQKDGFTSRMKLDLPTLFAVAEPFMPAKVPRPTGTIDALLTAKTDAGRDLQATVTINGTDLGVRGGSLKAKRVGPLDMKLQQQITADHIRQRVEFPGGTFSVPSLIDAAWSASVDKPSDKERKVEVSFGPVRLDLVRAISLAAPFLPAKNPLKELTGEAFLRSMNLTLSGPDNNGSLSLSGLGMKLPHVRLTQKTGEIKTENIELVLDKLECPLVAKLPTKLTADVRWSIKRAGISGAKPISLQGGHGTLGVIVDELDLKSKSPRKVTASAVVTQISDLDRASVGTQLIIKNLHKQVRLLARAAENGDIEISLPELIVTIASFAGVQSGKQFGPIPLSASLTASSLRLSADKAIKPTVKLAAAQLSAGDFIRVSATAALSGGKPQHAATSGNVRLDLQKALLFAAPFVPKGMKGEGIVTAMWDLVAPLPEKAFVAEKNPLRTAKAGLALCDKLEAGLKLDNIFATIPSAKSTIKLTGLRSDPALRFSSIKKGGFLDFNGGVLLSGVSGLAGAAGKLPSQRASLQFSGGISDWSALRLHEELRIDPLAVSHEAEINVNRLNLLLDEKQPFSLATLIKRLDATLFATLDAALSPELKQILPGLDLAGNVSGSARADLSAGREITLRAALKTKDFGVKLTNGTKVEGMRSDINFNRVYSFAAESRGERWTPLSAALVRPQAVAMANQGATEIVGRINEDLRGDQSGARSFSIRRVTTKTSSGVPLVLTALEGDLLFTQEKTGLSFFQGDLLGGTLLARGVFDLKPEIPVISAAGSFSNLDITYLLPKDAKKRRGDQDAEITGEMSLTAPLTAEQRELFEQLRLGINIRKIGADTLERALFSLDPYERNEQVVAQRKTLRLGTLKGMRATAVDGAFSMEGEVLVKGITFEIPKVERMRISELPMRQELVKNRKTIKALRGLLDLVRADALVVGPKGEIILKRRGYEK